MRDGVAHHRDQLAAARDLASEARDEFAAALDAEIGRLELELLHLGEVSRAQNLVVPESTGRLAVRSRAQAAVQRRATAEDRAHAANDRECAALDRLANAREIANAETDVVTRALRRRVGLAALQREMDRTYRTKEQLTVVFIDVDGLKRVNDDLGHAAGDRLLRATVWCVTDEFRSYDLIVRFGGDKFVCSITGDGLADIDSRFDRIAERLDGAFPGASISTGIAERRPDDTVDTIIDRADCAMIDARPTRRRRRR